MQREQNTRQPLRKRKPKKKSALTASRANRTKYSQRNRKHHKENAEQKSPPRRDQCLSPLHQDAHRQEGHQGEARPAGGGQAAHRRDPQPRDQPTGGASRGKLRGGAHPARNTGTLPPAGPGLQTAQKTTTIATDNPRSIRHRIAHHQQDGEPTSTHPALAATRWSKKRYRNNS